MNYKNILISLFFIFFSSKLNSQCLDGNYNYKDMHRINSHLFVIDTKENNFFTFSMNYSKYWYYYKINNKSYEEIKKDKKLVIIYTFIKSWYKDKTNKNKIIKTKIGSTCIEDLEKNEKYIMINLLGMIVELFSYIEIYIICLLIFFVIWKSKISKIMQ